MSPKPPKPVPQARRKSVERQLASYQKFRQLMQEWIDLGTATHTTHFYLRGLLRNGGIFYASPVFVTVKK